MKTMGWITRAHLAVSQIVNPELNSFYKSTTYEIKQVVGIDTCKLLVATTGIRGSNDLMWVGKAANHAAKMAALSPQYPTRITKGIYDKLSDTTNMWSSEIWKR
ncbi:hypothetical protein [Hymenobacter sp. GOD-10R]|uniref:hypothetical protein n=1 Tax=Hymenobacter sp. GOD-10R TaxID=3093922 RepID=UPI002D77C14B|nr:hypothetical protein [Hymenobacter sp. GOD-10R]WRQ31723.1 hypothetical protein SD425_28850 [Hymenobacter sp. GOD-10R]